MNATVYARGQMVIPAKARRLAGIKQGDVLAVEPQGHGRLVLVRLVKPGAAKYRIVHRRGRHPVAVGGRPITSAEVRALDVELP